MNYFLGLLLALPGIIIGLAFHEFAHAYVSHRLGDPTPKAQGRLTISPLAHIDPIGFLSLIFFRFGWGKPVEINPRYYNDPRRGSVYVGLAGPISNIITAVLFALLIKIYITSGLIGISNLTAAQYIIFILRNAIIINVYLALFNLIPVPPLDGFNILVNLIPMRSYSAIRFIETVERYGMFILIGIVVSGATKFIIGAPAEIIYDLIVKII